MVEAIAGAKGGRENPGSFFKASSRRNAVRGRSTMAVEERGGGAGEGSLLSSREDG